MCDTCVFPEGMLVSCVCYPLLVDVICFCALAKGVFIECNRQSSGVFVSVYIDCYIMEYCEECVIVK